MVEITYTEEMNRFINHHISVLRMDYMTLAPLFNARFGTSQSWNALRKHGMRIGLRYRGFLTEEQKQWIRDHFYMEGHAMQREFNRRFNENRTYSSMRNARQRLNAQRYGGRG